MADTAPQLQLQVLRRLGLLERYTSTLSYINYLTTVSLTLFITHPSAPTAESLQSQTYTVLRTLLHRFPHLSVICTKAGTNKPRFARLPSVDLKECVEVHPSQAPAAAEAILGAGLNTKFAAGKPQWKIVIIPEQAREGFWVSYLYSPSIHDGSSAKMIVNAFVAELNLLPLQTESETNLVVSTENAPPLPPTQEEIYRIPTKFSHLCGFLRGPPKTTFCGTTVKAPLPAKTHTRILRFSAETTGALLAYCRVQKTTITGFLGAALGCAVLEATESKEASVSIALSMRRYLKPRVDENTCGRYISGVTTAVARGEGVWDGARKIREMLQDVVEKKAAYSEVGMLRWIDWGWLSPSWKWFFGLEEGGTGSVVVSNLGVVKRGHGKEDQEGKGGWTVEEALFLHGAQIAFYAFIACVVSTEDGPLSVALCWQEGVVDDKLVEAVVGSVEGMVEKVVLKSTGEKVVFESTGEKVI